MQWTINDIQNVIQYLLDSKKNYKTKPFFLGISGIDASGKGFISKLITTSLVAKGYTVHLEHLDGWLSLPEIRFSDKDAPIVFYQNGFRMQELKTFLIEPYKKNNKVSFIMNYLEETWETFQERKIEIDTVDFFILEGIFLFQDLILPYLDSKIWIECSFEIALNRALIRNQEGLKADEIVNAYKKIYFPAQEIHFEIDHPLDHADLIYINE